MPVVYYTKEEVQEYTRLLASCYAHISEGSATTISRNILLADIAQKLGWHADKYLNENPEKTGA